MNIIYFFNPSCCFCNKDQYNGIEAFGPGFSVTADYKINFFRHNQSCIRCCNSIKTVNSNFFSFTIPNVTSCLSELLFFVPRIDTILLPRFAKMLVGLEQYSFAFSTPKALRLLTPKQLIVAKDMIIERENRFIPYFENSNILVTEKFEVRNISLRSNTTKYLYKTLFNSISSKTLFIKAKVIELCELSITANFFYQLLSPQLVELKCISCQLTTLLNSVDFVRKVSNIEKFLFLDTDFNYFCEKKLEKIGELPIECKALIKFCLPFKSLNLTLESFKDTTETWSKNQKKIFIILNGLDDVSPNDLSFDDKTQSLYDLLTENKQREVFEPNYFF